jgi:hypothetical protein
MAISSDALGAGDNITFFKRSTLFLCLTDTLSSAGTSGHALNNERCTRTQSPDEAGTFCVHFIPLPIVHIQLCQSHHECACVASDADEHIVLEEDEEEDEGYLFAGQGRPRRNYLVLSYHSILSNII